MLNEDLEAKYINENLIENFIEKRKYILNSLKQDYLHQLVHFKCLEEDICSVARISFDAFCIYAKLTLENDYMIQTYLNEDIHTKELLFTEINNLVCCKVLNEIMYAIELEFNQ